MSTYVYVTRRTDPFDDSGPQITRDEWLDLIAKDADLSLEEPPNQINDRTIYAAWKSYPGGYTAWFGLAGGNIEVKGLDDGLLGKLLTFARTL